MSFFSVLAALALEQLWALGWRNPVFRMFGRYANGLARNLNAGETRHGVLGWMLAVLPPVVLSLFVYYAAYHITPVLAWAVNVLVLYLTMGFRQFSHAFTGINLALNEGDLGTARGLLEEWTHLPAGQMSAEEVSRVAIEQGVIDSYRHVFGTIFWFCLLPGPSGAIIYRMASLLERRWGRRFLQHGEPFGWFAMRAIWVLDWLPLRLTALSFAIVGNFVDAVDCWQNQAASWADRSYGVLLASAAGALGIRLGDAIHRDHTVVYRPGLGLGDEVDPQYLQSAVGLLWRTVVFWVVIILLVSVPSYWG